MQFPIELALTRVDTGRETCWRFGARFSSLFLLYLLLGITFIIYSLVPFNNSCSVYYICFLIFIKLSILKNMLNDNI